MGEFSLDIYTCKSENLKNNTPKGLLIVKLFIFLSYHKNCLLDDFYELPPSYVH
jgi:hypothetical protein